ncbi:DEAD/DEAH box helicase [Methylomicrobium album]|uniref:Putative helicase n=1 Tax=Methylomicrobium album BG8 TaxID=686340 RepID=H8GP30_METAL|nr:DEAD/DEAH box helicase [Methylomicrobium album]EIC28452.1 putative helicase [Methylomicrobium album BG8]
MATFLELYQGFDADPFKRGKQFERFTKWFLKNDPEWSTQVDQVWLWEEYPKRWGIDCGIDLVFQHKNGETWAVQAKCYSSNHDITKNDVDKFLSESNRAGIDKRLLIATTDRIGKNAIQVCEAQEKTVVRFLLSDFERSELEYPSHYNELYRGKRKEPPKPRPHQLEAIVSVADNFQHTERGQLIMACGTGKTFTTLWIKEELASKRTLVLLPSLSLLSQTLREWTFAASQPFDVLCVCSDETVGKRGEDETIQSVSELAFPVTSDAEEIRRFINGDGSKVIFSTYQSSPMVADAQAGDFTLAFDLVVADEAHRCTGKITSAFSTVLDNNRIIATKRLFATATPRTYTASVKKTAEDRGVEVACMDDETVFGKVLYSLPFGKAIRQNLLTDYRIVIIGVDSPMIAKWIKNRELIKTDSGIENDAESLAAQIGLLKAIKDYDLKRVISFHSRVSRAESFKNDVQEVLTWIYEEHRPTGELWSDFVSGAMATDKRRQKLDYLKGLGHNQRGLITNARCLSEGVDVPSLDGVAFIDPKNSQVDIVQAVGRAIRLSEDKKFGTIVIPVFIEQGDNAIASIEASNFKPVWEVLNAFKAHDEVLSQQLDMLRTELGRKSGSKVNPQDLSKITIDLPASVDNDFGDSLRTHLVEQSTAPWNYWYGLLEIYAQNHGNASPPCFYITADGFKLGIWVSKQRTYQSKNLLGQDRMVRLEALPGWSWDPFTEQWENAFEQLQSYVKLHGNASVSQKYVTSDGLKLGNWISDQRQKKFKNLLSQDRIERLEALTGWSWDPTTEQWEEAFEQLRSYVELNGNAKIHWKYVTNDGLRLGTWTNSQRTKKSRKLLSQDRIERLEALPGWSWDRLMEQWEEGFEQLQSYIKLHGIASISQQYVTPDGFKLGAWSNTQRTNKSKNLLPQDRIERLEALPGWSWRPLTEQWEEAFGQLQSYVKQYGNAKAPGSHITSDGFNLGGWVNNQRESKSKNLLSQDRIARLEALTGWSWDPYATQWEEAFEQLQSYVSLHGNAKVTRNYVTPDGFKLASWVNNQRTKKSQNSLPQDRIERLEALPGWSWRPLTEQKDEPFEQLQSYVSLHGNANVPRNYVTSNGFNLGGWVNNQRVKKSQNSLPQDRIERLEALPGWSWRPLTEQKDEPFEQLQSYVSLHGNANVPRNYVTLDGFNLGNWVKTQRTNKSKNQLSLDQIARFDALPGWHWDLSEKWDEAFVQLQAYVYHHNNVNVPRSYVTPNDFNLGTWVSTQRQNKSKNLLSQDRIERLESIPGWSWDPYAKQWEEAFGHLQSYVNQCGHAMVSGLYVTADGFKLGSWISGQRKSKSKNLLSQDRINRLEAIPGWRWDVIDEQWNVAFDQLKLFVKQYGNAGVSRNYVTTNGFKLGIWVKTQRDNKNKKNLSQHRIDRLESLPGWVWSVEKD